MSFTDRVLAAVGQIPKGRVASYGLIGGLVGSPRAAQAVGQVLHRIDPTSDLPWWRVVNSQGYITVPCLEHPAIMQASLLRKEGVTVEQKNSMFWIDMRRFGMSLANDPTDS
jgi:methylated-DNA-protein-cysteine methyltransferase-like protein